MARPRKWRKVCCLPDINTFGPMEINKSSQRIIMTVEEYETIRLMDFEGLNQEETSQLMGVARSTVQRIYDEARKKIADCLVNGKVLKIEGGDYKVCSDTSNACHGILCPRHRHGRGRYSKK